MTTGTAIDSASTCAASKGGHSLQTVTPGEEKTYGSFLNTGPVFLNISHAQDTYIGVPCFRILSMKHVT
jgi:hypothetical protein